MRLNEHPGAQLRPDSLPTRGAADTCCPAPCLSLIKSCFAESGPLASRTWEALARVFPGLFARSPGDDRIGCSSTRGRGQSILSAQNGHEL
jgi:hypothetical protein